jgi:hypothetical protein
MKCILPGENNTRAEGAVASSSIRRIVMKRRRLILVTMAMVALLALVLTASVVLAQANPTSITVPYSSRLTDESGQLLDGMYAFKFELYAAETGGRLLWSETHVAVTVKNGDFALVLGEVQPILKEVVDRKDLWLAVSVRGPQDKDFTLLEPRQHFNAPASPSALACPHNHFTDSWPGANTEYGLLLENTSTGDGLRAYNKSTVWNYAAVFGANIASTGYGTGVYGYSAKGAGMYANSDGGDGLEATTASTTKSAVYAHAVNANGVWAISTNKQGVHGGSTNTFGVEATGGGDASWSDLIGDLLLGGDRGEIFVPGTVAELYSNGWIALDLDNDNNSSNQFEIWNGADVLVYKVDEAGNTTATGTKSAVVKTSNYGPRLLYAVESSEVWFEDIGTATLKNGTITIAFEPIFAETVDLKADYHVYVTPLCDEAVVLFVTAKTTEGFAVKGVTLDNQPSSCAFDYRVMAKRWGYSDVRLAPADTGNSRTQGVR